MGNTNNHVGPRPDEIEVKGGSVAGHLVEARFDFGTWLREQVKNTPWWTISIAFHLVVLLIFAAIMMSPSTKTEPITINTIKPYFEEQKKIDMQKPSVLKPNKNLPKEKPSEQPPVWEIAPPANHNESEDNKDQRTDRGDDFDFLSDDPNRGKGVYDIHGVGGGIGGDHGLPDGGGRVKRVSDGGGGGKNTRPAVISALIWLARHQNPDGSWGAVSFQNQCSGTCCKGTGSPFFNVGLTGLALLAFTGATYTPASKDIYNGLHFGEVVREAALYLKGMQKADGSFGSPDQGKFMYNQAVAAYALADLVALMKVKGERPGASAIFEKPAQKAIDFLVSAQNPGKAWRYHPGCGDNDASITGWCAMALKAAAPEEAGLNVPDTVWSGIKSHLDDVTDPIYGQVGYTAQGAICVLGDEERLYNTGHLYTPPSLTAVGIMMRIFMGERRKSPVIRNGAELLKTNLPVWDTSIRGKIDYYYWFYSSYALNQYDGPKGPCWTQWNEAMKDVLLKHQCVVARGDPEELLQIRLRRDGCTSGSWDPIDRWSGEGGRVYATAINALTLEVYYRLRIVMGQ